VRRLARAPLLHFLVLGAAILVVRQRWSRDAPPDPSHRIVLTADDRGRLRDAWIEQHGTPPDAAEEAGAVRDAIDEEVLFREAMAAGVDRRDRAVQERLVRLGGFLGEDALAGPDGFEREARRLGLAREDVVVRRHLVQMMRLAAEHPEPADEPSDAELQTYLDGHAAEFAATTRVRLTHVYLSADRHGATLARDARRLLDDLRRRADAPAAAAASGDPFLRGATVGPASHDDLVRVFGPAFASAVDDAPVGAWVGPVPSPYGLHLVRVEERLPERVPALAEVRSRVRLAVLRARGATRAAARMEAMRARYVVSVEGPPLAAP
jgi:hypothetical protein